MAILDRVKFFGSDRIQWMAALVVVSFLSVLLLRSQSAASYPTYLLAIVLMFTFHQWRDVFSLPLVRIISVLLAWLCLSVFWSDDFSWRDAGSIWVRALLVLLFVVAMAECQFRGQLNRWMAVTLAVAGGFVVIAAIANFYITNPIDNRLNGLGQLDTHVVAALVYGAILVFVLQLAIRSQSKGQVALAVLVALSICYAIYLSDSRNAWVSVTAGALTLVLGHMARDSRSFILSMVLGASFVVVALVVLIANPDTNAMLLPRGDSFRIEIWTEAWRMIVDNNGLFSGRGILTVDDVTVGPNVHMHPHSLYLALWYQGGVVALLLYIALLIQVVRTLLEHFESYDAKLALAVLSIAVLSHILDGHELIDKVGDTWMLVWMPVGIAVGLSWKNRLSRR